MKFLVLILLASINIFASTAATLIEPCVEFQTNPVGTESTAPRFSWKNLSTARNVKQESYRIELAASPGKLGSEKTLVWDSGKVNSSNSHLIDYTGPQLSPATTYWWKVTVWTADGKKLSAAPASFTTARNDADRWEASWIGINDSSEIVIKENRTSLPARYLRKQFSLAKKPVKAILSISGIGSSYCYINGREVSDDIFGPLPSWYDASVPYITYNVTDMLQKGQNAIGVALGNGRYFPMRKDGLIAWGLPRLIARLDIECADGTSFCINTDTSWKATSQGPVRANNEYDGEIYDASMALGNWTTPGYDDTKWNNAQLMQAPAGKLTPQRSPSLKIMEVIKPVSVREVAPRRYIVDMGQNMVGYERVRLNGRKGQPITLRFAEVLQPGDDTNLYVDNLRTALAEDTYIPDADGEFSWHPEFVSHGYRFMEITGPETKPSISDIEGMVIYDEMETTGRFNCSNNILNQLHRNAYWGIRGNYRGMPTDCPQRDERHGWLGDRTTGAHGESFLFNNALMYRKWLADIEESMSEEGSISDVSPRYWTLHQYDVTWPAAYFYVADMLYRQFGDDYSIRRRYNSMKKWISHITRKHMTDSIITTDTYGDWCLPPESLELIHSNDPFRKTDGQLLSTAVFYSILNMME
ncbi:MAG: family 78 glycoside hydrolase catalytic domain, partial [Muribaculaceae bacterium]|nr:family 78 glycoside hydrolase catalytic domain [Muribaculaceae bacterium]